MKKEGNINNLIWTPIENFKEIDEEEKNSKEEGVEFTEYDFKQKFTTIFNPESYENKSINNIYNENYDNLKLERNEDEKSLLEDSMQLDLIKIDIENAPFNLNIYQEEEEFSLAITGHTFESLWKLRNKYLINKNEELKHYYLTFRKILQNGFIFARMSPEHKTILVECLREEKFTVLMCGDGANDCGALRAADVGVSLSIEEASIAAHFTSNKPDISCLIKLLREGKASLTTSIQTFKYMMIYSLIQFTAVTLLMIFNSYLSDNQFLASDLFIIFPLAFLIARTGAYEKLTRDVPNGALISLPIISSILLQIIIQFLCQYGIYLILSVQNYFDENQCKSDDEGDVSPCLINSVQIYFIYLNIILFF